MCVGTTIVLSTIYNIARYMYMHTYTYTYIHTYVRTYMHTRVYIHRYTQPNYTHMSYYINILAYFVNLCIAQPYCNTLQHTATHCNTLQHISYHMNIVAYYTNLYTAHTYIHKYMHTRAYIRRSVCCSVLQCVATHCNTLHHTIKLYKHLTLYEYTGIHIYVRIE